MDLNILIEDAVTQDNSEQVDMILSYSLQPDNLLWLIIKTKKYNYLSRFAQRATSFGLERFLDLVPCEQQYDDLLSTIVIEALEQGISLEKELYDRLYGYDLVRRVAFDAGTRGISFSLLTSMYKYVKEDEYISGIAFEDRDDLLPDNYKGRSLVFTVPRNV